MDIKDFILIVGGLLIAAVLVHGFWIAWRARSEPLQLEIVPELIPDDHDEMDRFRGELPNGGARPATPEQVALELGEISSALDDRAPVMAGARQSTLPLGESIASISDDARRALDRELLGEPPEAAVAKRASAPKARRRVPTEPDLFTIPEGFGPEEPTVTSAAESKVESKVEPQIETTAVKAAPVAATTAVTKTPAADEPLRPRVAEVTLSTPAASADPLITEPKTRAELRPRRPANQPLNERSVPTRKPRRLGGLRKKDSSMVAGAEAAAQSDKQQRASKEEASKAAASPVEDLILIHLVAPKGDHFSGAELVEALRSQGLKFGDMNIFHRRDPMMGSPIYSVANALEPGFFDLSDIDAMNTPGVTFFLQLPGPEDPAGALEDMLGAAQVIAHTLGGQLRDENKDRVTNQIATAMKQRVSDYMLKRLSRKAL
ncbi:MAG: cell division protein ZipA [Pseudomonadales bacterium]